MSARGVAWLEVADGIARYIADSAIWHDSQCTWMGALAEEGAGAGHSLYYRSLSADLYGGTAGVGLFLAETASLSGDSRVRRTALGALRHAHVQALKSDKALGFGLYIGALGIAYALARAGLILNETELLLAARDLATRTELPRDKVGAVECDLMSGLAGAVIGLLMMAKLLDDPVYRERAVGCAEGLLAHAIAGEGGVCWSSTLLTGQPALLGLSHGASGVGVALLEAAHSTGDSRFRRAAQQAFAYERSLYSEEAQNWPDLRQFPPDRSAERSFMTSWCHGAPGVALARLRATELDADDVSRSEGLTALETTRKSVREMLDFGQSNYSLCHGLCGNAGVLVEGQGLLGDAGAQNLAHEVADLGASTHAGNPGLWPCGVPGGATPALFLGLAGIGHFYLRVAQPSVPSVLLLRPDYYMRKT